MSNPGQSPENLYFEDFARGIGPKKNPVQDPRLVPGLATTRTIRETAVVILLIVIVDANRNYSSLFSWIGDNKDNWLKSCRYFANCAC